MPILFERADGTVAVTWLTPEYLAQVRRAGESDEAAETRVATIIQAARTPVTLEDLRAALEAIAPRLSNAPDDSLWMLIRRGIGDLVVVRQAASPSPRPADRMKRARRTLDEGQVEAALAEVAHMPGIANAASWVAAAKQYIAARTALRDVEAAAMEAPAAPASARTATN